MKKENLLANLLLTVTMLIGLAMVGIGIFSTIDRNKKMAEYETVRGNIVDCLEHRGENGTTYAAVYAYKVEGEEYTIQDAVSTSKVPRIGERVQVMYDPAAPENAFVKGAVTTGFVLILIGGMFFCVPFLMLVANSNILSGKWKEGVQGLFMGVLFAGLGYGLCFGLKLGLSPAAIFLFLFGSLGVYGIAYSIYVMIAPAKNKSDSENN